MSTETKTMLVLADRLVLIMPTDVWTALYPSRPCPSCRGLPIPAITGTDAAGRPAAGWFCGCGWSLMVPQEIQ